MHQSGAYRQPLCHHRYLRHRQDELLSAQQSNSQPRYRRSDSGCQGQRTFQKEHPFGRPECSALRAGDKDAWGYDPFYALGDEPDDSEILQVVQLIGNSVISIPADTKDKFWPKAARNLFCGLAVYHYKQGLHDLISIVDAILGQPIETSVAGALSTSTPSSPEYRYLIMFLGMEAATLYGVYAELASNLTVFANNPGLRYALRDNPRKITPRDLERGKQIFLCVDQTELAALNGAVKLILDQMLYAMQRRMRFRTEAEVPPLLFIIDELPQLLANGPLEQLIQGLRVLRSSRVRMILAFQTIESLESAYSPCSGGGSVFQLQSHDHPQWRKFHCNIRNGVQSGRAVLRKTPVGIQREPWKYHDVIRGEKHPYPGGDQPSAPAGQSPCL